MEATPPTPPMPTSSRVLYLMLALSVRSEVATGYTVQSCELLEHFARTEFFSSPLGRVHLIRIYISDILCHRHC